MTENARLTRIQARWDARAVEQLRAEVARLAEENERLATQLEQAEDARYRAEQWAESWRDDFMRMCEETSTQPGLTIDGHLVTVQSPSPAEIATRNT
jgi:hypothetical protein